MFILCLPPLFLEICWTNQVVRKICQELAGCTKNFTSSAWCNEIKFYDLSPILQVRKLRLREYMPCPNLYNQRSGRAQASCLPCRKKKKWNLILRAPSSVPGTYLTVKRAASGQPVNTDSTDPANHEVNLSLPRSLLLFLLFVTLQGLWDLSSLARMRSAPPTLEAWSP